MLPNARICLHVLPRQGTLGHMASLYRRTVAGAKSPFWWCKWKNPDTGKVERFSTGFRTGDGNDYTKARQERDRRTTLENLRGTRVAHQNPFADWVVEYLNASHASAPRTLQRYLGEWSTLADFLDSLRLACPGQVTRQHCLSYPAWRKARPHRNGSKPVCNNTVILELKLLRKILNEAVTRGFIPYNPALRLKLKGDPPRPKDELSGEHVRLIQAHLARRTERAASPDERAVADFLTVSFEIARLQGIRLSETYIALKDIDLDNHTMWVMGKGRKLEELNINPELLPLFARLKREGRTFTYQRPAMPSLKWHKVFSSLRRQHPDFRNLSFHSTRVTVISRLERAGASEAVVMKTVLHSSSTVHRVYRKIKREELLPFWAAVGEPSSPAAKTPVPAGSSPENPGAAGSPGSPPENPTTTAPSSSGHRRT